MNQEKGRRRDGQEQAEEKGKSSLSFFKAYEKKPESNSAHNGTRNITGPPMLLRVDEALQQPRLEPVSGRKVSPYPLQAQAQHSAGEILAAHLRTDEEASHIDHPFLKALARRRVPSYPLIPDTQTQSAGTKTNGSQPPVVRSDQITQLPAHQSAILQRVLGQHQLVPCSKKFILFRADLDQPEALDLFHLRWHPLGCRDRSVHSSWLLLSSNRTLSLGKSPEAPRLQYPQCYMYSRQSRLTQTISNIKCPT